MRELLIVGAGPHTLCTLLRLLEPHADSSVDGRYRKATNKARLEQMHKKQRCDTAYRQALKEWLAQNVTVVDQHGDWMCRWCRQFQSLRITHLRSSSALHVDPVDTYALVNYAEDAGRAHELQPLRSICKSRDFHGPFHTPSSPLFEDQCRDCVNRYCLEGLVTQGKVASLVPVQDTCGNISHHIAHLADGTSIAARRVFLGIGSTNLKRMPAFAADLSPAQQTERHCSASGRLQEGCMPGSYPSGRMMHAWDLVDTVAGCSGMPAHNHQHQHQQSSQHSSKDVCSHQHQPSSQQDSITAACLEAHRSSSSSNSSSSSECSSCSLEWLQTNGKPAVSAVAAAPSSNAQALLSSQLMWPGERVVIVGSGLTSAHMVQLAAAAGASKVTLLAQGPLRVKQFDVDIAYMGRFRDESLRGFRRLGSFEQRLRLMRRVLQGGSMSPEAFEGLQPLLRQGLLHVQEGWRIAGADWDWQRGQWDLWSEDGTEIHADRLWLATGSQVDARAEPLLASLLSQMPVQVHGGLPAIQPTLEWVSGSGLYVLGAYAALQLGPGALNLAGAKTASVQVVDHLVKAAKGEPWLQQLKVLQERHLM